MAVQEAPQEHQGLICPLCFFNLSCGHSFCKNCLVKYDEQQDRSLYYLQCPACMTHTPVGKDQVAALSPNFSCEGTEGEFNSSIVDKPWDFCSLHCQIYKDIFCTDCKEFICLTCYLNEHQGHKVQKKEELEADLEKERDTLIQKCLKSKREIGKSIKDAEQSRFGIHSHLDSLEGKIKHSFAQKLTLLFENKERLLKEVSHIRMDSNKIVDVCIAQQRQSIDDLWSHFTVLSTGNAVKCINSDALKKHKVQFGDLESLLQKISEEGCHECIGQSAEKARFCPADEKVLDLGHLEFGKKALESTTEAACGSCGREETAEGIERENVPSIPAAANLMTVVSAVELPDYMSGMAALSQDEVVVGYGYCREGTDCFSVKGDWRPHLSRYVGHVYDIAFLTDGRLVVSNADRCSVYYAQSGQEISTKYMSKLAVEEDCFSLCSDQKNNIYAVNGNAEICVFSGSDTYPKKVETTKGTSDQICVTKTGAMITSRISKPSNVTVYFRGKGPLMCSGKIANSADERFFADVDSQDRVLIAMVRHGSSVLTLTRYRLLLMELIEPIVFQPLELPHSIRPYGSWCYMISLTPNLIAFAADTHLYFIELSC